MRADGTPTYLMANTTDDSSAGVDLITRGSDLLPQTPIQVLLYLAIVGKQSIYAHLPLMYNEFGNKLSKRSPDTKGILQYKAEGYLPEAIIQFALSLGNSSIPTDIPLTFPEMIEMYDISKTNNRATSFVEHKIKFINRLHMRALSDDKLSEILKVDYNLVVNPELLSLFKHRCDTMVELAESITFTISVVKNHMDEIKQLAIDNFSADSCKHFREQYFNGISTPPINEVYRLIA
jgi:glutamyl/glutaminyl-tRNA synthetase